MWYLQFHFVCAKLFTSFRPICSPFLAFAVGRLHCQSKTWRTLGQTHSVFRTTRLSRGFLLAKKVPAKAGIFMFTTRLTRYRLSAVWRNMLPNFFVNVFFYKCLFAFFAVGNNVFYWYKRNIFFGGILRFGKVFANAKHFLPWYCIKAIICFIV